MSGTMNRSAGKAAEKVPISAGRLCWILPLAVSIATFLAFLSVLSNGYVWDDRVSLVENRHVRSLGWSSLKWMFTTTYTGPYQPLSWLSYAIDHKIWGLQNAWGVHLTSVLLHIGGAVVFYLVARRLLAWPRIHSVQPSGRGARPAAVQVPADPSLCWAAAAAMAFFALHPLRVESVAWATERRDVLSGLFYVLTILSYLHYCLVPTGAKDRKVGYGTTLALYVLALLSKGTTVSLPIVLIVLDIYPLRRLGFRPDDRRGARAGRVVLEKVPFLLLAFAAGLIALAGQADTGAMMDLHRHGFGGRVLVACYGLAFYLYKTFLPFHLSPLYELPSNLNTMSSRLALSMGLVGGVTAAAIFSRATRPWLAAAWACYIAMLLPVLGLVQVGAQAVADRYSYLASLCIALLVGAGVLAWWRQSEGGKSRRRPAALPAAVTVLSAAALGLLTWQQSGWWKDDITVWTRALEEDPGSAIACYNLANLTEKLPAGADKAIAGYRRAVSLRPDYLIAWLNLGNMLSAEGRLDEAAECYREVLKINSKQVDARANLTVILLGLKRYDEALEQARQAVKDDPAHAAAHNVLGLVLTNRSRAQDSPEQRNRMLLEAAEEYRKAIECNPLYAPPYENLSRVLLSGDRPGYAEAVDVLRRGVKNLPDDLGMANALAWLLATCPRDEVRNGSEALALALRVCQKTEMRNPSYLDTLAAAYAEVGKFEKAAQVMQQAVEAVTASGQQAAASTYRARQQKYLSRQPYRLE
jgi:tetratricopeptide (TPR) repeat protein